MTTTSAVATLISLNPIKRQAVYLHEISFLRAITTFTVVTVHSVSAISFLAANALETQLIGLFDHSLNYNRELFMFVTGLLLAYIYYPKPLFSKKTFWYKRFLLVFIPYLLWTIIYTLINTSSSDILVVLSTIALNTLTGNGSSQLYYIVLALQFYALFPFFLSFLRKVAHHPWWTLSISFILQLLFISFDYFYIQTGSLSHEPYSAFIIKYQNRVFPSYQFFFILGGFAGIYMNSIRRFFAAYGKYIPVAMVGTLTLYAAYYFTQIHVLDQSVWQSGDVLQPSVVIYSTVVIVFAGWIATVWVRKQRLKRFVTFIADASFGIYFVHVLILNSIITYVVPLIPHALPIGFAAAVVVLLTFGISSGVCYLLLNSKYFGWAIGKPIKRTIRIRNKQLGEPSIG